MKLISSFLHLPPSRPKVSLDTRLMSARLVLRVGDSTDWKQWRALREMSRDYLTPWEPQWPPNALSYGFYCALLRRQWRDWRASRAFAFTIFLHTSRSSLELRESQNGGQHPALVGGITLSDIQYAAAQKGTIGYWTGMPYAGQGIMTEAVGLVCDFAFETLRLQRIEASCMLTNEASKTVLHRAGFEEEGTAKAYLQINGVREDHLLWGRRKQT